MFRLMTRLYKSFKSEVANFPPGSCTTGRRSGGITGSIVRTIHTGEVSLFMKDSMILSFLRSLFLLSPFAFTKLSRFSEDQDWREFHIPPQNPSRPLQTHQVQDPGDTDNRLLPKGRLF